jgi:hypothetical protein
MDVLLESAQLESLILSSEVSWIFILPTREDHSSSLSILAEEYLLLDSFEVVLVGEYFFLIFTTRIYAVSGALHFYSSVFLVADQVWLQNEWQLCTRAWIIIWVVTIGLVILSGVTRV